MGKVVIIGAGPAGLTAAYQLCKAGKDVEVFEASQSVGGMAKSLSLWGQTVDLGPHRFFSKNQRVNDLWFEVLGSDFCQVNRQTRILYNEKLFSYPLQPLNAFKNLGAKEASLCLLSYLKEKTKPSKNVSDNYENWMIHNFGKKLYNIFFQEYSEKLWGIPCHELDVDFAKQRIRNFSVSTILSQLFFFKTSETRTTQTQFSYPLHGSGRTYEKMASFVTSNGGKIHFNEKVEKIHGDGRQITAIETTKRSVETRNLVSTMPLGHLVTGLSTSSRESKEHCAQLHFRNTLLIYFLVDAKDLFSDNWIYIQSPKLKLGRITNYRNWSPELCKDSSHTILSLEYWCNRDDLWLTPENEIFSLAEIELRSTGLIKNAEILERKLVKLPNCYPVYRKGYKKHVSFIAKELAKTDGLQVIGRYGAFKYNNQDHSIMMGLLAADNIIQKSHNDLWAINSDFDEYQETDNL